MFYHTQGYILKYDVTPPNTRDGKNFFSYLKPHYISLLSQCTYQSNHLPIKNTIYSKLIKPSFISLLLRGLPNSRIQYHSEFTNGAHIVTQHMSKISL